MKKIVVAAEVFSSNLGDYAIYDSLSTLLTSRNIKAIPLDISFRRSFTVDDRSQLKSPQSYWKLLIPNKLKHHKLTKYILNRTRWYLVHRQNTLNYWSDLISDCDAVIVGGGQLLTDTSAEFHTKIALIAKIANQFNKPICILGCGVGNDLSLKAQKNIAKVLDSASFISLRDLQSANKLKPLIKDHTSIKVSPDLAFALKPTSNNYIPPLVSELKTGVCGFNIMPFEAFKKYNPKLKDVNESIYIKFWKRLAIEAIKENLQVYIMTNGNTQDYEQADSIYKSMLSVGIEVVLADRPTSPSDLYNQISNVDYLITTRMHAGIIGKAYGKSVATLIWDDKIPGVWQEAGNQQVAIQSDIILSHSPWTEIQSAFEASNYILLPNLHNKISNNIESFLKIVES